MGKKELATLIDAYADAKMSENKYLMGLMIEQLEAALNQIFDQNVVESEEEVSSQEY